MSLVIRLQNASWLIDYNAALWNFAGRFYGHFFWLVITAMALWLWFDYLSKLMDDDIIGIFKYNFSKYIFTLDYCLFTFIHHLSFSHIPCFSRIYDVEFRLDGFHFIIKRAYNAMGLLFQGAFWTQWQRWWEGIGISSNTSMLRLKLIRAWPRFDIFKFHFFIRITWIYRCRAFRYLVIFGFLFRGYCTLYFR